MRRGILARFCCEQDAVIVLNKLRLAGCPSLEAYSPLPSEALADAARTPCSPIPPLMFVAGLFGSIAAYALQWWTQSVDYPLNVGGRPQHAPLAFLPISFETGILFAGLAGFIGFLLLSGLPRLHHPLFELKEFEAAMVDGYLVAVDLEASPLSEHQCRVILTECGGEGLQVFGEPDALSQPENHK